MRTQIIAAALAGSLLLLPGVASAQSNVEGRVGKLESEMRAVQRKVFPGGGGQYLQPEVTAPAPSQDGPGTPATSAVADLTARVASLEGQMSTLTGQIEQNQYQLRQLKEAFEAYKRGTDAKLAAGTPAPAPVTGSPPADAADDAMEAPPVRGRPATPPKANGNGVLTPPPGVSPVAAPVAGSATVAGIEKPSTGDAGDDEYMYGYRLWAAKKYPEAEAQLKKVVATYPKHKRASYAQNLLGRAYLDEGKPSLASMAFYDNYKKMPEGERAPDSLYYLAQALMKLNKPADACKVYGELTDVYGAKISSGMKADIARGRTAAKCS